MHIVMILWGVVCATPFYCCILYFSVLKYNKWEEFYYMIKAEHISKRYKNTVLRDITFNVNKGECIGILGANGCGKTTLLTIMAGVAHADGGKLFYENQSALNNRRICSKYTGYVPQTNPLIEELTAGDNLKLWCKDIKSFLKREEIKRLGIEKYLNKTVSKLSGGMKRRISIAIALVTKPPVLILDEPGTALDLKGRAEIADYLLSYVNEGGTVVMTTHLEAEIQLCTRLYMIKEGVLVPIDKTLSINEISKLI